MRDAATLRRSQHDLRLVPAAAAAWTSAAAVVTWPQATVVTVAVAGTAATVCLVLLIGRRAVGRRLIPAGVAALAAATAALCAAMFVTSLDAPALTAAAEARTRVDVVATVTGDAAARSLWGGTPEGGRSVWVVPARITWLGTPSGDWTVDLPVDLRLDGVTAAPPPGVQVAVTGTARPPPGHRTDISAVIDAAAVRVMAPPGAIDSAATAIRSGLRDALRGIDPDAAALVAGLAVGDESTASPLLVADMRDAGLSHLTAVSGGNVAIVLGAVLLLARWAALPTPARVLLAALALIAFVIVVRPQPSVLRAAVMGGITIMAFGTGARRAALPALAASVVILVCIAPVLSTSLGFTLSVVATAGLVLWAPRILGWFDRGRVMRRMPFGFRAALALAIAAQAATVPIIASLGSGISLAAVPANLLAAPAVPWVTVFGLLAALLAPVLPPLAHAAAWAAAPGGWWIAEIAHRASALPLAVLPWPGGWAGALAAGLAGAAAFAVGRGWRRFGIGDARPLIVTVAVAAAALVTIRPPGQWPPPDWVVVACDVGQGDALVVRGADAALLVDTGPDPVRIDRCLGELGIDRLSAIVLTHAHADHVGGLDGVLAGRPTGAVFVSPLREPPDQAARVERIAVEAGVDVTPVTAGAAYQIDADLRIDVLWPRRVITESSAPNNTSVVLAVTVRGVRVLLTGDVETAAQVAIAAGGPPATAGAGGFDIAKVPHHGSAYFYPAFPTWVDPRIALITVGRDNAYGHPSPEALDAWAAGGAVIGRTDTDGSLAVTLDGTGHLRLVRRGVRD